jgi:hypothetical protein
MAMFKQAFESAAGVAIFLLFLVVYFPGGTIMMALSCDSRKLDGWDLFKSLLSSAC